jgi:hypothetical protein
MQNKKTKLSLTETVAGMGAKPVVDMTGKPDMTVGGGSHIPSPITMGIPATLASVNRGEGVPATHAHNTNTAAAASMMAKSNSHESSETAEEEYAEEDEGDEEEDKDVEEVAENFRNALSNILGEDVSPELVTKLEAIFEAAVTQRVENKLTNILVELDEGVKQHLDTVTETLVEKVDDYLDYVVEEWMQENAVAVEQGIKTQIAENFIVGMKNLFENHYIDVPAEKYNVLDDLYAKTRELNNNLNETINENINLKKQVALTECAGIFVAETRDLADTQVAKLQNLMENVSFTSPEEYREKLCVIKENYINKPKAAVKVPDPIETFSKVNSAPTTLVENYVNALGRINKKV